VAERQTTDLEVEGDTEPILPVQAWRSRPTRGVSVELMVEVPRLEPEASEHALAGSVAPLLG